MSQMWGKENRVAYTTNGGNTQQDTSRYCTSTNTQAPFLNCPPEAWRRRRDCGALRTKSIVRISYSIDEKESLETPQHPLPVFPKTNQCDTVPSAILFRAAVPHNCSHPPSNFPGIPPQPHHFINSIRTSFALPLSDIQALLTQVLQARCSFEMPNTKLTIPRVLTVAGSDSSGGAGIEADLKVITANGCYGMTAITALTAQNTLGVDSIHHIPGPFLRSCLEAVLSDVGTDVVKTGYHPYFPIIEWI